MRWGKRVKEPPPVVEPVKVVPQKPSLEDIYNQTLKEYGFGGDGSGQNDFVKNYQRSFEAHKLLEAQKQYEELKKRTEQFEQWSRYKEPQTYGGSKTVIAEAPVEPVPQGKTLDELFLEDEDE
jgi:hypothetical protein